MAVDYSKYLDGNSLKAIRTYITGNFQPLHANLTTIAGLARNATGLIKMTNGVASLDGTSYAPLASPTFTGTPTLPTTTKIGTLTSTGLVKYTNGVLSIDTSSYKTDYKYRPIKVNGTQQLATGSSTALDFVNDGNVKFTWVSASNGVKASVDLSGYQPLDADLTAIAGLSGTSGFLKKTAANTWSLDTNSYQPLHSLLTDICYRWDQGMNAGVLCGFTDDGGAGFTGQVWIPMGYADNLGNESSPDITFQWTNYPISTGPGETSSYNMIIRQKLKITRGDYFTPAADMVMYLDLTADRQDDGSSYRPAGIGFFNYILTANTTDTNDSSNNLRIFLLPSKSAGTHILATTSDLAGYQPKDADLTAIAGLSGTSGFLKKTAANTWSLDTTTYIASSTKGVANGVASLDSSGKIPTSQLPASITGSMEYKGTFNATSGSTISGLEQGWYYICSTAGTKNPDGTAGPTGGYAVGDWAVYNGSSAGWAKIDNQTKVSSVCGKTGAVTLSASDVSALPSTTKYAKSLTVSGRTVTLKDQDGTQLSQITTQDTTYESKAAASGGTAVSLVTTGEKYTWNNKQNALTSQTAYSAKGSAYKVPQITTNSLGQVTLISEVDIAAASIVNTAGSESITVATSASSSKTLNVVTRDTVQNITANKTFYVEGSVSGSSILYTPAIRFRANWSGDQASDYSGAIWGYADRDGGMRLHIGCHNGIEIGGTVGSDSYSSTLYVDELKGVQYITNAYQTPIFIGNPDGEHDAPVLHLMARPMGSYTEEPMFKRVVYGYPITVPTYGAKLPDMSSWSANKTFAMKEDFATYTEQEALAILNGTAS